MGHPSAGLSCFHCHAGGGTAGWRRNRRCYGQVQQVGLGLNQGLVGKGHERIRQTVRFGRIWAIRWATPRFAFRMYCDPDVGHSSSFGLDLCAADLAGHCGRDHLDPGSNDHHGDHPAHAPAEESVVRNRSGHEGSWRAPRAASLVQLRWSGGTRATPAEFWVGSQDT